MSDEERKQTLERNWELFRLVNDAATTVCERLGWAWKGDHLADDYSFFTLQVWAGYNAAKKILNKGDEIALAPSLSGIIEISLVDGIWVTCTGDIRTKQDVESFFIPHLRRELEARGTMQTKGKKKNVELAANVGTIPDQATEKQIEIFFSYSHKDEKLRDKLADHLSIMKRNGIIQEWYDRKITGGTEWKGQIDAHLNSAQIILLLISANFISSDYCYDIELKRAMERHDNSEARVIPIILRACKWQDAPFGKLEPLPNDAKPVTSWTNRDQAFTNIVEGIERVITEMRTKS